MNELQINQLLEGLDEISGGIDPDEIENLPPELQRYAQLLEQ